MVYIATDVIESASLLVTPANLILVPCALFALKPPVQTIVI